MCCVWHVGQFDLTKNKDGPALATFIFIMLRQASLQELKDHVVTKRHGHLVMATRYYPRFLSRHDIHEYRSVLGPEKELLDHFKKLDKTLNDHNLAFERAGYEEKFNLSIAGAAELERLARLSLDQEVYLICHCERGQKCHRELLMIMAQEFFGVSIAPLSNDYPVFRKRFADAREAIKAQDAAL